MTHDCDSFLHIRCGQLQLESEITRRSFEAWESHVICFHVKTTKCPPVREELGQQIIDEDWWTSTFLSRECVVTSTNSSRTTLDASATKREASA